MLSIIIGALTAFIYLQLSAPQYSSIAALRFEDKKSEIAELITSKNWYDRTNKVESERTVILSKSVILSAVAMLDYQINFFDKKVLHEIENYPFKPLDINIVKMSSSKLPEHTFEFSTVNKTLFRLSIRTKDGITQNLFKYGNVLSWKGLLFKIHPPINPSKGKIVKFRFNNPGAIADRIYKSLKVDDSQNTSVLTLTITDTNQKFCQNALNKILEAYINYDRQKRESSLSQTSAFIDQLVNEMSSKAKKASQEMQKFQEENEVYDARTQETQVLNSLEILKKEKQNLDIQKALLQLSRYDLNQRKSLEPRLLTIKGIDPHVQNLVTKYQDLILVLNEQLNRYTPDSKVIVFQESQLKLLSTTIENTLTDYINANIKNSSIVSMLIDSLKSELKEFPGKEAISLTLGTNYEINQKIYNYLAEKRLETLIAKAAVVAAATVLDHANFPDEPISPKPRKTYLMFTSIFLFIGAAITIFINTYNPFIFSTKDIENLTSVPILGTVRKHKSIVDGNLKHQIVIQQEPRSLFSESMRFVRGNLSFLMDAEHKVICITSETSGEGKSFISLNLAYSLSLVKKRVILVAADLRKSSNHFPFEHTHEIGLSRYLSGQLTIDKLITQTGMPDLDFISSGTIPPNPSELLQDGRMSDLMEILKSNYDVVIIDSAPIGLVSDIKPIIKLADINLFVLRSGFSKHQYATTPERLKNELNLSRIAIILNGFENDNFYNHYYNNEPRNHYQSDNTYQAAH